MDWYKTLILILFGLSSIICSHFPLRKYFFFSSLKTWKDAQVYCREKHTDLAIFESIEEVNQLNRPFWAWIGLRDDPLSWKGTLGNDSNSWRWSTTGQEIRSQYSNWINGEPNYAGAKESCVLMESDSTWKDDKCSSAFGHFCYTDMGQNQKTYVFISESRTWEEAQAYCRQHHTDLAVITSVEENAMVQSVAAAKGWIGLYRTPWAWSDMSPVQFTNWQPNRPNNNGGNQHCIHEHQYHQWNDNPCEYPKPFICHEVRKSKITMRIHMKSTNDLSDPVLHGQILQKVFLFRPFATFCVPEYIKYKGDDGQIWNPKEQGENNQRDVDYSSDKCNVYKSRMDTLQAAVELSAPEN